MSQESGEVGGKVSPSPGSKEQAKGGPGITEKEKELAGDASLAFTKGDYTGCLGSLEKLEIVKSSNHRVAKH